MPDTRTAAGLDTTVRLDRLQEREQAVIFTTATPVAFQVKIGLAARVTVLSWCCQEPLALLGEEKLICGGCREHIMAGDFDRTFTFKPADDESDRHLLRVCECLLDPLEATLFFDAVRDAFEEFSLAIRK